MELDLAAEFFVNLDNKIEKLGADIDRMNRSRPIFSKAFGSGVVDAAGDDLVIPCTSTPPAGRVWNLLSIHIFTSGIFTTIPGAGAKWGALIGIPGATSSGTLADASEVIFRLGATSESNLDASFSSRVYWVHSQETVYAIVSSATAGTPISFVAWYAEYPVEAVEALSIG